MKNIFEFSFTVLPQHLDALRHVNNVVYVQWMQDIATKHWTSFVSPELDEKILWVARRHEIDYLSQAFLNDELMMRTWTGDYNAASWDRHYELIRKSDNKKIISAKSVWVLLDKKTFKPKRIDNEILKVLK
ncbi:MAG TPA: thioesterase family protein [Chitinophagaceae bacterium]|nr:thioesterase family protein [Chitinophagaceae bacterium]